MTDLYIIRGYITPNILYSLNFDYSRNGLETTNEYCNLTITKEDDSFNIQFKNNSYKPFLVWTYRWDSYFKVNDSVFIDHLRYKSYFPKHTNKYEYGLDCGTGAGTFTVNPFETFKIKKTYKELVNFIYWENVHQYNSINDTINDLIYNKPLLLVDRDKEFKIFKRNDLTDKDSTEIELYLPLFTIDHKTLFYVKSNKIKISYKDIINNLIKGEKRIHDEFKNF
ncbi:MAG: hypothetical protein ACPGU6_00165 [Tenacibaculum sp.]